MNKQSNKISFFPKPSKEKITRLGLDLKKIKQNEIYLRKQKLVIQFLTYLRLKKRLQWPSPKALKRKLKQKKKKSKPKLFLKKQKSGTVFIKCSKRNIYLSLSDSQNRLKATISTGYLKVKGKARKAIFFIKKIAKIFTKVIVKSKIKKLHLSIRGRIPRKIKRIFLKAFKLKKKQFRFYRYTRRLKSPHNGCRPPKRRRK